jgi:hypothetical protein
MIVGRRDDGERIERIAERRGDSGKRDYRSRGSRGSRRPKDREFGRIARMEAITVVNERTEEAYIAKAFDVEGNSELGATQRPNDVENLDELKDEQENEASPFDESCRWIREV